jgi:hypothetical protein
MSTSRIHGLCCRGDYGPMSYQHPSDPHFYGPQDAQPQSPAPYLPQPYSPGPYQQQPPPQYVVVQAPPSSGLAVTSMVMGILGLVSGCCSFGVFSLLAVVFGHMALPETKSGAKQGHGMAVAGLVMGYVVFLPALIISIMWGGAWLLGAGETYGTTP